MKKKAIFGPFITESFFVHKWLDYYSRHFDKSDMYALYFGDDKEYEKIFDGINVIKPEGEPIRNFHDKTEHIFKKIWETYEKLLEKYEYVMFTDSDEFLYHPSGLGNYIDSLDQDYVTCKGYEIIHMKDAEPSFNSSKKILEQRSFWYRNPVYFNKTLITNRVLSWNIGNHRMESHPKNIDHDLLLVHMHKYDYEIVRERHEKFVNMKWSDESLKKNMCWHYRLKDENLFYKWFYVPDHLFPKHKLPADHFVVEKIPENIKKDLNI